MNEIEFTWFLATPKEFQQQKLEHLSYKKLCELGEKLTGMQNKSITVNFDKYKNSAHYNPEIGQAFLVIKKQVDQACDIVMREIQNRVKIDTDK